MENTLTYGLDGSAEWEWFGLTASVEDSMTSSHSVSADNCCYTSACCLTPMKAYVRWEYDQRLRKQQISTFYYVWPGTSINIYTDFEDCQACNEDTRQLGDLHKFPTPELLPGGQNVPLPHDREIMTIAELCGE
jgi:hypothetical protein